MPHDTMSGDYELKKNYDKALQEYQRSLTLGVDRTYPLLWDEFTLPTGGKAY